MRPTTYLLYAVAHLEIIWICASARVPGETAKKWCEKYQKTCPKWVDVPGSFDARPGEFPHAAAVGFGDETNIKWHCGGTLISEKYILSAAHCLSSSSGPPKWILLGTNELLNSTTINGKSGQIHPIIRSIAHPLYKRPAVYHDIGLLEIGPAVTPNPRSLNIKELHPACLGQDASLAGRKAIGAGWGRISYDEDPSNILQKKRLEIREQSVCKKVYESKGKQATLQRGIDDTMFCAAVREGERDTCSGDGGVALGSFVQNECVFEVWGVVSFGKSCGNPEIPGVYTKVREYISWIEDIVWPA